MHEISYFPRHCGSVIFNYFVNGKSADYTARFSKCEKKTAFAIFTDREDQKEAYDALKKKFKILYQSPILEPANKSYQEPYFIVIYLNKKP